ncbi:hypothetical protein OG568_60855 (plasmid) [Streptomyces sp. NBC_01450]|uniref:hypothetical protein n=1 Tax=Streptomyces sp. NBC_01450 TaxID=2903871 RepID=UPI002E379D34|nr:hypothetical protein [Streptomyces sp. NBC_01450]
MIINYTGERTDPSVIVRAHTSVNMGSLNNRASGYYFGLAPSAARATESGVGVFGC